MLGLRLTSDSQPRWKNGIAAHSTTGVASASSIHTASRSPIQSRTGRPSIGPMVMTSSGSDSAALTQNRLVKSTSSGFGPSSPVGTPIGSSAMPQIGQEPGLSRTISRVHRAGVLRAFRHGRLGRPRAFVFCRIGLEFRAAASRAEMKGTAGMFGGRLAGMRVDGHAADRVADDFLFRFSNVAARHASAWPASS